MRTINELGAFAVILLLAAAPALSQGFQHAPVPAFVPSGAATLVVTSVAARLLLPAKPAVNPVAIVVNVGSNAGCVKFGTSTVQAITSGFCIPAGASQTFALPPGTTHVSGVSLSGTATFSLNTGN